MRKLIFLFILIFSLSIGVHNTWAQTVIMSEDFASITSGNNTTTGGSSTAWTGNTNFPTVVTAYQAGGVVRIGASGSTGSITSKTLDLSVNSGSFKVSFKVKGWTTVEGNIKVTVTGLTSQTVTYTATMSDPFESKTLTFTGGTSNSTVKIETTSKRAFIDDVNVFYEIVSSPSITINSSMTSFSASVGSSSPQQNYTVSGTNLTANVVITPQSHFLITTDTVSGYSNKPITLTQSGGVIPSTTIYVVFHPTSSGTFSDTIVHTSSGATTVNLVVTGSTPVPTVTITGTLTSFSTSPGSPSTEQTYTVSGSGLTNDIVITPPSTNFEISQTSGSGFTNSPITLTQTGGTVGTTTIYVRFNPSSVGTFTDTIFNSSIGATTQRITVSGVSSSAYSFPLVEDFSYTVGDSLGANGWACHSGSASTNIMVVSPGLTYANYSGSNIGNAVKLVGSGCDNNKIFGNRNSGSIYCSFLVNVDSAKTGGDYFVHFGTNPWSTSFYARVFVKSDASNNIYFGIMKNSGGSATVVYSSTAYSLNTTYLLVFKYTFNASSNDDVVSLFVITGSIPLIEPTPDVTHSDAGQNDATGIGGIALRQGGSSAPTLTIDGIRVGTSWSDVPLPISLNSFTSSVVGNNVTLNWTTATETNNSHFEIERQSGSVWQKIGSVAGSGTTNTEKYYSYTDRNLNSGTYGYRLKQLDYNGNFQYYNLSSSVIVGTPKTFSITSYPNPFNPIATIKYNLPQDADVKITVFNALGQRITTLVNEYKTAGFYSVQLDGSALASGVYFYKITAGNYDAVKKIMLIK